MKKLYYVTSTVILSRHGRNDASHRNEVDIVWADNEQEARDLVQDHYENKDGPYGDTCWCSDITAKEALGQP